jgi:hypothetical protein
MRDMCHELLEQRNIWVFRGQRWTVQLQYLSCMSRFRDRRKSFLAYAKVSLLLCNSSPHPKQLVILSP